jgi:hypothetical protein
MITKEGNPEAEAIRPDLARLAEALLRYYSVTQPPVPVERMLQEPPVGLSGVDLDKLSLVMEHGLYHYAPRMAMARLLCREITHSAPAMQALQVSVPPSISYADVKFFARCLLMPPDWVKALSQQGLSVEQISSYLQVPTDAVITRLAELELPIPATG